MSSKSSNRKRLDLKKKLTKLSKKELIKKCKKHKVATRGSNNDMILRLLNKLCPKAKKSDKKAKSKKPDFVVNNMATMDKVEAFGDFESIYSDRGFCPINPPPEAGTIWKYCNLTNRWIPLIKTAPNQSQYTSGYQVTSNEKTIYYYSKPFWGHLSGDISIGCIQTQTWKVYELLIPQDMKIIHSILAKEPFEFHGFAVVEDRDSDEQIWEKSVHHIILDKGSNKFLNRKILFPFGWYFEFKDENSYRNKIFYDSDRNTIIGVGRRQKGYLKISFFDISSKKNIGKIKWSKPINFIVPKMKSKQDICSVFIWDFILIVFHFKANSIYFWDLSDLSNQKQYISIYGFPNNLIDFANKYLPDYDSKKVFMDKQLRVHLIFGWRVHFSFSFLEICPKALLIKRKKENINLVHAFCWKYAKNIIIPIDAIQTVCKYISHFFVDSYQSSLIQSKSV